MSAAGLRCVRCGRAYPLDPMFEGCPQCASDGVPANVAPFYDEDSQRRFRPDLIAPGPRSLWRYDALLPVPREAAVTLQEGMTPLVEAPALARALGVDALFLKDESRNPTWSFKDRASSLAVSMARRHGARVIVAASTGNAGASAAAYAARAGMPCVVLTYGGAAPTMQTFVQSYGALLVMTETKRQRWDVMREAVHRHGWYPITNYTVPSVGSNAYGTEGHKTMAYEIAEALGWTAPDTVVVPTGLGDGYTGIYRGFQELRRLGLTSGTPRLVAAEVNGALLRVMDGAPPSVEVPARSPSVAISIGTTTTAFQTVQAMRESDGFAVSPTEDEIMAAQRDLATLEGVYAEASSAITVAALRKAAAERRLPGGGRVVCVITSSGLKDPSVTAARMPAPVRCEPTLDGLGRALRQYGYAVTASGAIERTG
jgi:threonine synthase